MKLENLIVIFIIIILPIILILSLYISNGLKTIEYQSLYDTGLFKSTQDAVYAFEQNTSNNPLSGNPEIKRDILNASIKMFEKSLCNNCNISVYDNSEIEKYIPAMVFGMYDGFYMYAPSKNSETEEYEHGLKNYVYYSETLDDGTVIRYSLDNYVVVSGVFKNSEGNEEYQKKEGYVIDFSKWDGTSKTYNGVQIISETINGQENNDAINYYNQAYIFSKWLLNEAEIQKKTKDGIAASYLNINLENNDPEDANSPFVQHKRTIIKNKIEGVLNSTITAYSNRIIGQNYKMPKLSEEDWQKIYSNISIITFFQGKNIGLTEYNGYCVLNSTNSREYVNPELMYFTDGEGEDGWYHDIRCTECLEEGITLTGYKIGAFGKKKVDETDDAGNTTTKYVYDHSELACYDCINGQINNEKAIKDEENKLLSVKEYIDSLGESDEEIRLKTAYYTSLARQRDNQVHI